MPREFGRNVRIAEAIRRIAAPLLAALAREKKLGMVTITEVVVASDLSIAKIFVSVLGNPGDVDAMGELRARLPQIRSAVAQDLRLKKVPSLKLSEDSSAARSVHLSELLKAPKPRNP
jgi:ribosome-binding factor A